MNESIKTWLFDILQSIIEIESYFDKENKTLEFYLSDLRTRRAVERNLEIIGEATNRILKIDSAFELNGAKNIVGTRNRIIHGYDTISDELIWSIIMNNLPKLKSDVEQKLKE